MRHTRRGFTLIEMVIVCVLVGGLMLISIPRIQSMRDSYSVQAAKQQLVAAVATARAGAIQKGRTSRLRVGGNAMSAVVPITASESVFVVRRADFGTQFGVTLELGTPRDSVLTFEARGFAAPRLAATQVYRLRRGAAADSVCVGALGQLMTRGCTL
jgi:prepilin-type N-terminal cleavage/methylation domain-containing protein